MDYIINGGRRINGEIAVYGSKNCALPLLGATVLTEDEVILHNCPNIADVDNMLKLLTTMGKKVTRHGDTVVVSGHLTTTQALDSLAKLLRGSALILGSTIAAYNSIDLPLPGGCAIGARPMDIHLAGLERMGISVLCGENILKCSGTPQGADYTLRFASVGATENLLCAAVLAQGETVLHNCATEPEVEALAQMLVAMGGKIEGVGTSNIVVKGVSSVHGAEFTIIPDRIVTATYLSAAVATYGKLTVTNCNPRHLRAFLDILRRRFEVVESDCSVTLTCNSQPSSYGRISTAPYPLFPTDMQSLILAMASFSDGGRTVIHENLFESRLTPIATELISMGADIAVTGNTAVVSGRSLQGAEVTACDLRGGAALVIAGLNAAGQTTLHGVENICRGYLNLAESLSAVGADVQFHR